MRPTVSEVTELAIHIEKRNLEKCQQHGATPYRIEGLRVDTWDLGAWREGETHPSKAALARWEASKATRACHIAHNGLARMASPPWNARVVRLRPTPGGGIDFYTGPNWRREGGPARGAEADVIRRMADDDETIIDTDLISLLRLLDAEGGTEEEPNAGATGDALEAWPRGEETAEEEAAAPEPKPGEVATLPVAELEGHPKALAFWPDSEQRRESVASICASVKAYGVRQPLTVCRKSGGGWWVIDGCTRLEAAKQAGLEAVPCRATGAGEENVEDEIFISNMDRTRFSSAVRVMRYLERNADAVVATAERNADPVGRSPQGRAGKGTGFTETGFTSNAIADRLSASKPDVVAGIELLRCRLGGLTVKVSEIRGGPRTLVKADEDEREAVEAAYRACLAGSPLRRWVPAAKGHEATADKAKKPIDYADLMERALTSLQTCFAHWDEMTERHQEDAVRSWKKVVAKSPDDVMAATRRLLPPL